MKSIPTTYKGVQFRSKLEAKWAVFFDSMRVKWKYEPFSFNIGRHSYTPDFLLPEMDFRHETNAMPGLGFGKTKGVLFEIKPIAPNSDYKQGLHAAAETIKAPLILAIGTPEDRELQEFGPCQTWDSPMVFIQCQCGYNTVEFDEGNYYYCKKCKGRHRLVSEATINQLAKSATYHRFDLF